MRLNQQNVIKALSLGLLLSCLLFSIAFGATATKKANIYASANQKSKVIAIVQKGTELNIVSSIKSYYKVKLVNGKTGFILKSAVSNNSQKANTTSQPVIAEEYVNEVLKLVNAERKKVGASDLILDIKLQSIAQIRATELITKFSHTRPNGKSVFSLFDELGLKNVYCAENIASGGETPNDVVNMWMNSPSHRKNMLDSNYQYMGIAKDTNGTKNYWAQVFWGPL